mgnify:CR=1 FL=1
MQLVLATQNPGKVAEIADLLADAGITVLPRPDGLDETIEDAGTLEGNAEKKAAEVCSATGLAALADDTGLFVDALDGRPGVLTARFGGWERLLDALKSQTVRTARFRTVLTVVYPDGREPLLVEGIAEGLIADEPEGEGGFGYDPVFVPLDGDGRSFANMTKAEKNQISHRGRALRELLAALSS